MVLLELLLCFVAARIINTQPVVQWLPTHLHDVFELVRSSERDVAMVRRHDDDSVSPLNTRLLPTSYRTFINILQRRFHRVLAYDVPCHTHAVVFGAILIQTVPACPRIFIHVPPGLAYCHDKNDA